MLSNTTLDAIGKIPYGIRLSGQFKSYKVRYSLAVAEVFMSCIPQAYHTAVKKFVTKKGFVLLSIIDHRQSMVWHYADIAKNLAHKAKLEGIGQLKLKI